MGMADVIKIGGVEWRPLENSTMEHDGFMNRHLALAGLPDGGPGKGEAQADYAQRLMVKVAISESLFDILGGLLIPHPMADSEWTPEMAKKTADFMRKVSRPEDKNAIYNCIFSLVSGFFHAGLSYSGASMTASGEAQPEA